LVSNGTGTAVELMVPKSVNALYNRAAAGRYLDSDVSVTKSSICMAAMQQGSLVVPVTRVDIGCILQSMILDPEIPPGSFLLEYNGSPPRVYCDETGVPVQGPELYHGTRWTELLASVPRGGHLLVVYVHSDGVESAGHSRLPYSLGIGNFPSILQGGEKGLRVIGMGSRPEVRKPRGTSVAETLSPLQKAMKYTINSRAAAEQLADLEKLAECGADFLVRQFDGTLRQVRLFPRIGVWKADMAEQQALLGLRKDDCSDCFGLQHATADQRGPVGSKNRPHMDLSAGSFCATALQRTVQNVAARQHEAMLVARTVNQTAGEKRASELGVRLQVPNSLSRLRYLIPWDACGPYGIFSFDVLHGLETGIMVKGCHVADCVMQLTHGKSATFGTKEDCRDLVDQRLMHIGSTKYDAKHFSSGFWGSNDIGKTKGADVAALTELLSFAFCGCDLLIANSQHRILTLKLLVDLTELNSEAYTPQWYSNDDFYALDQRVRQCITNMHSITDLLKTVGGEKAGPGNIFDIPKVHRFGSFVGCTRRFGSLMNSDTEQGERSQKALKKADVISNHDIALSDTPLLQRLVSLHLDESSDILDHGTSGHKIPGASKGTSVSVNTFSRGILGSGSNWAEASACLAQGRNGPPVDSDLMREICSPATMALILELSATTLSSASAGASHSASPAAPCCKVHFHSRVTVPCEHDKVDRHVYRPGHCVLTDSGAVVQIMVPVVMSEDDFILNDARGMRTRCLVSVFVPVDERRPMYPELPVPWLRRGQLSLLPVLALKRRVHVVPLFGNGHRPRGDARPHYLLNTLGDRKFSGPSTRKVFLCCITAGCIGKLPEPLIPGTHVKCPTCHAERQWF